MKKKVTYRNADRSVEWTRKDAADTLRFFRQFTPRPVRRVVPGHYSFYLQGYGQFSLTMD